ncbi:uncharacterized protein LOC105684135 [Athalia rosae]|uniref:uncharacterized protein LOC105684135 n=1 Tax=Athalia rosae TaxID=37344 RepID=UPI0020342465|nr:uncharacterized protein LOC105684135 [Athalia rosae]
MLKKALTKSGLRILRAIKKLSRKNRPANKSSESSCEQSKVSLRETTSSRRYTIPEHEAISLSWSLASLDTKSVDTYLTSVSETGPDTPMKNLDNNRCCCCAEYEENEKNENKENEICSYR